LNSRSVEDFIFTVYQICENGAEEAHLSEVAGQLSISRAAASKMARKIAGLNLIGSYRYSAIRLSPKGKTFAKSLARRHRTIEVFLHDKLGLRGKELETQAHALEHSLSGRSLERLAKYLGSPKSCPHGKAISPG
jgi:DtxR family Mn-dependent transcriptional regulator